MTKEIPTKLENEGVILVTGAEGFIGRAVCKLLQRLSYPFVALDLARRSEHATNFVASLAVVETDIADRDEMRKLFETRKIASVIHLAAILPTAARRDPAGATEVNIDGSANLLEMSRQFGVRRFVFGSSLSVYGSCPADEVVAETRPAAPEDLYGAAKLYVEQLGQAHQDLHGTEFASLRIGRVVGPGAQSKTSNWRSEIFELLLTKEAAEIKLPYVATERLLVVHVDDVARMLVGLVEAPRLRSSIYNSVCESVVVEELKRMIEGINPLVHVRLGHELAMGNPRLLDSWRLREEFEFRTSSISDWLGRGADGAFEGEPG